jgi:hypothetical protein
MDGEQEYLEPGAWNSAKVDVFKEEFFRFLAFVSVNSKENGVIRLGERVYRAQQRFLDGVFAGLSENIHDFKILKSRQLGISTMSRALTLFWIGVHAGLKGYMIFDTDAHKEEARLELLSMVESLPDSIKFPRVKRQNRYLLELDNGSMINFASAGVRAGKSSGTLGRSSGVNFCHGSEMCSWDNTEGLESFKNALAEDFEDRLYIWESTARGFNQWEEMWREARLDSTHQRCIFIGWWAKDNQIIRRGTADFERYGTPPPSEKELKKIAAVKAQYGWEITDEQLAWVRRKMDPTAEGDGDAPAEFEGDGLRVQEQPWTEEEAFQQTGSTFFDPERLTELSNTVVSNKYKTYSYAAGLEFTDCRIYPSPNQRSTELKVWEEREDDATYIIAADVAFGANEKNDRSAIQVMRAYADGLDQVAEYAWPLINSMQFAWVIASLLGYYAGNTSQVYLIIELNGPGEATWNELQTLKRQLAMNYFLKDDVEDRGLRQMFFNVRNYIYGRSDSMSAGHNYQWRTTERLKVTIMERLRDFISNKMIRIRSSDTVTEMRSITREGDSIEAEGNKKDDRVLALAFAIRCWEERVRRTMIGQRKTREREAAKKRMTITDQISMYNNAQLDQFFAVKQRNRARALADAKRAAWRGR